LNYKKSYADFKCSNGNEKEKYISEIGQSHFRHKHHEHHEQMTEWLSSLLGNSLNLLNQIKIQMHQNKKKRIVTNKRTGNKKYLIIGTIDSFMFKIGNKQHNKSDYFIGLVKSIADRYINISQNSIINYAKEIFCLDPSTLIVIDEAQNICSEYRV